MPTNNLRLNITLDPELSALLTSFAKHKKKSVSNVAQELLMEALEKHENMLLAAIAKVRDARGAKTISHSDAWS